MRRHLLSALYEEDAFLCAVLWQRRRRADVMRMGVPWLPWRLSVRTILILSYLLKQKQSSSSVCYS